MVGRRVGLSKVLLGIACSHDQLWFSWPRCPWNLHMHPIGLACLRWRVCLPSRRWEHYSWQSIFD
jgi:hypothetical protein